MPAAVCSYARPVPFLCNASTVLMQRQYRSYATPVPFLCNASTVLMQRQYRSYATPVPFLCNAGTVYPTILVQQPKRLQPIFTAVTSSGVFHTHICVHEWRTINTFSALAVTVMSINILCYFIQDNQMCLEDNIKMKYNMDCVCHNYLLFHYFKCWQQVLVWIGNHQANIYKNLKMLVHIM
jgi:hypothetical protein